MTQKPHYIMESHKNAPAEPSKIEIFQICKFNLKFRNCLIFVVSILSSTNLKTSLRTFSDVQNDLIYIH